VSATKARCPFQAPPSTSQTLPKARLASDQTRTEKDRISIRFDFDIAKYKGIETHLLLLAHKFLKNIEIENTTASGIPCAKLLVQSVYLGTAFEELDEPPEVFKVEVVPLLRICLLRKI
jgi:hypothetical protein